MALSTFLPLAATPSCSPPMLLLRRVRIMWTILLPPLPPAHTPQVRRQLRVPHHPRRLPVTVRRALPTALAHSHHQEWQSLSLQLLRPSSRSKWFFRWHLHLLAYPKSLAVVHTFVLLSLLFWTLAFDLFSVTFVFCDLLFQIVEEESNICLDASGVFVDCMHKNVTTIDTSGKATLEATCDASAGGEFIGWSIMHSL